MRNFFVTEKTNAGRKLYDRTIRMLTAMYAAMLLFLVCDLVVSEVPDDIYVREGEEAQLELDFPFTVKSVEDENGETQKKLCSIFGVIPIKEVTVNVVEGRQVYVSGEIVGIYTECPGVFVIKTCEIENMEGNLIHPAQNAVKTGDYILSIDGRELKNKEDMSQIVKESDGRTLHLEILRNGSKKKVEVTPAKAKNGNYLLGIWIKDDLAGIGTLTYVTPTGEYGTLGHGMGNGENAQLFEVSDGTLYTSSVIGIQKGQVGKAGELKGVIRYGASSHMGEVYKNTDVGIFGKFDADDLYDYFQNAQLYDVAYKQEIQVGQAQIISEISGEREFYDIKISYVDYLTLYSNKGLYIEVTDPRLLELTGGIVQGMSGSPIIQNGKLVGAVTHVLVNDPTRGYGIFIENMLDAAG